MTKNILLAIFSSAIFFSSCEKTPEDIIESITPEVKANINSENLKTNVAVAVNAIATVGITATKDNQVIVLNMPSADVGKYNINGTTISATYTPNITDSLNSLYAAYEGTIEITDINDLRTQLQGNFSFSCVNAITSDTIMITNGELNNIPLK